ncbi:hypothetical protein L195_g021134 [Trifolium pratense]|uniref:Integrase zinc-binding domain-containing protein n=1 Tax=Trifolium pratense TaxID=57577 RepID=A0A2K3N4D0_TRIPR|nr:hypothetical protein L195_g021134 [Trifolium pratense]
MDLAESTNPRRCKVVRPLLLSGETAGGSVPADAPTLIINTFHHGFDIFFDIGGRSLARKTLRAGYYWPTMQDDAKDHVLKCDKCQRHGDMHIARDA